MAEIGEWTREIHDRLGPLIGTAFGIEEVGGKIVQAELFDGGYPGLLPLWKGRRTTVCLEATPGLAPAKWPAVLTAEGQALSLAADAGTALPRFLLKRVLSDNSTAALSLAESWDELSEDALAVQEALGGSSVSLLAAVNASSDATDRDELGDRGDRESFERAHSRVSRRIDPSAGFGHFADCLDELVTEVGACDLAMELEAPWRRQAVRWRAISSSVYLGERAMTDDELALIIEPDAGIDSALPQEPSWGANPWGAFGQAQLSGMAGDRQFAPSPADPLLQSLLAAMNEGGMGYLGYAHAEAAASLDETGEPERAWRALQSSAWWGARNAGKTPPAILQGCRLIAERHGWDEICSMLDWLGKAPSQ